MSFQTQNEKSWGKPKHLADTFIQSDVLRIYIFFISMRVPWELNPQPFALLTQCSTTEPQEHKQTLNFA